MKRTRQIAIITTSKLRDFKHDMSRIATLLDETSGIEADGSSLLTMTWAGDKSLIIVKRRLSSDGMHETYDIEYKDKGRIEI